MAVKGESDDKGRRQRRKRHNWDTSMTELPTLTSEQMERLKKVQLFCNQETQIFKQQLQAAQLVQSITADAMKSQHGVFEFASQQRAVQLMSRIYIGSIAFDLNEEHVRQAFASFGAMRSVNMPYEPITAKHKGFCFIEYDTPEAAQLALDNMTGALIAGRPIKVGRPNNAPQAVAILDQLRREALTYHRIYVASINPGLREDDIRSVFGAFGTLRSCKLAMQPDMPTMHKGYGYIEFEDDQAATEAVMNLNMFELGGQLLRVCRALTPPHDYAFALEFDAETGEEVQRKAEVAKEPAQTLLPAAPSTTLDPDHAENVSVSGASQRLLLTQRLTREKRSPVVLLRNMVGADEIDAELHSDISNECCKFGDVEEVVIYQEHPEGGATSAADIDVKIFVAFMRPEQADAALAALNGRWFGGRQVVASCYPEELFRKKDYSAVIPV